MREGDCPAGVRCETAADGQAPDTERARWASAACLLGRGSMAEKTTKCNSDVHTIN